VSVSIAIPFFNEEACFRETLALLVDRLEAGRFDYQLVLVDNGSWDLTGELIDEAVSKNPRLKKVRVDKNQGYGWGIINGLGAADGQFIGYMCGDGQVRAEDVSRVIRHIMDNPCDMVKVFRTERNDGWLRFIVTRLFNWTVPFIFGLDSRDLNGTPKIFRRELLEQFQLESRDWFIDVEIMVKSECLGLNMHEIPIRFEARQKGMSHVSAIKAIYEFMKNTVLFKTGNSLKQWKKSKR
tara:strand:- start:890 stop:1606 length:717 start_codon:yes stop_codon:yes gene_type:complete